MFFGGEVLSKFEFIEKKSGPSYFVQNEHK